MSSSSKHLIAEIEEFLSRVGMTETEFNKSATGDWHFIRRLREGKSCTLATADAVRLFMRNYRPASGRRKRRRSSSSGRAVA